jgi:hypothetical protein
LNGTGGCLILMAVAIPAISLIANRPPTLKTR